MRAAEGASHLLDKFALPPRPAGRDEGPWRAARQEEPGALRMKWDGNGRVSSPGV